MKAQFVVILIISLFMSLILNLSHASTFKKIGVTWGQKTVHQDVTDSETVVQNNSLIGLSTTYKALELNWRTKLEFSQSESKYAEGSLSISNSNLEYALWQHFITDASLIKIADVKPYFGAGVSFENTRSQISYDLSSSNERNNTNTNSFLMSVGLDISFDFLYFNIEGRSKYKNEYQKKQPEYSYVLGFGLNLSI